MTADFDTALLYLRLAEAIEAATELRQIPEDLVGGRLQPTQIVRAWFRLDPRSTASGGGRWRPGDSAALIETVAVVVHHDLQIAAPHGTLGQAAADGTAVLRAVMTRTEISGPFRPEFQSRVWERRSDALVQELVFRFFYDLVLPDWSGPGVDP